MKISEILSEAAIDPYEKTLITGNILDTLKTHCSQALSSMGTSPLWRGSRSVKDDVLILDPSSGTRKSQNTSNYYTVLMDNSPYMKGWPKRSNSLICSTGHSTASSYGNAYAIYPFNGTKLAVCPSGDLWGTELRFPEIIGGTWTWGDINYYLTRLGFTNDNSLADLIDYTKTENFAAELAMFQEKNRISNPITPEQFIPLLQKNMAPDNVGFTLTDVSSWNPASYLNREVWFSAPCVAINYRTWVHLPLS